jgi:hypothetical protein
MALLGLFYLVPMAFTYEEWGWDIAILGVVSVLTVWTMRGSRTRVSRRLEDEERRSGG